MASDALAPIGIALTVYRFDRDGRRKSLREPVIGTIPPAAGNVDMAAWHKTGGLRQAWGGSSRNGADR